MFRECISFHYWQHVFAVGSNDFVGRLGKVRGPYRSLEIRGLRWKSDRRNALKRVMLDKQYCTEKITPKTVRKKSPKKEFIWLSIAKLGVRATQQGKHLRLLQWLISLDQGGGNLRPAEQMRSAWTFDKPASEFSLPKLECNIASKRSSMISRYLYNKPREATHPHSYIKVEC